MGNDGNDVIRSVGIADVGQTFSAWGGEGDDYLVGQDIYSLHGDEGNDTLTAVNNDVGTIRLEGGDGADTFQVTSSVTGTIGGTIDDPELLASISDFDPAEDVIVLPSNLPGPITPTYADGTLLLELGDGSFASVFLGVDSFDVSMIQMADIEAQVDTAFAATANGLAETYTIDVVVDQGLSNPPGYTVDANDTIEINLPEGTEGQLIAVHSRWDVNYGNNSGIDREA